MAKMPFYKKIGFTLALVCTCDLIVGTTSVLYMGNNSQRIINEVTEARAKGLATMDALLTQY